MEPQPQNDLTLGIRCFSCRVPVWELEEPFVRALGNWTGPGLAYYADFCADCWRMRNESGDDSSVRERARVSNDA